MGKFLYKSINEFIVALGTSWTKCWSFINSLFSQIRQKNFVLCCFSINKNNRKISLDLIKENVKNDYELNNDNLLGKIYNIYYF
jgi:hypothetical protein